MDQTLCAPERRRTLKFTLAAILTALAAGAGPGTAAAEQAVGPMVAVPAPDAGGGLKGCYRVQGTIYGSYHLSFCLGGHSGNSYQVVGSGLACSGGLDWYDKRNGRIEIDLYRSLCGKGQAWTGDSLSCRIDNWRPIVKGMGVQVAVPATTYSGLSCTYLPVAGGYPPIKVTANRV